MVCLVAFLLVGLLPSPASAAVRTFNLLDFSGFYRSGFGRDTDFWYEYGRFDVGDFPLEQTTRFSFQKLSNSNPCHVEFDVSGANAKAGCAASVTFRFPDVSWSGVNTAYPQYVLGLWSDDVSDSYAYFYYFPRTGKLNEIWNGNLNDEYVFAVDDFYFDLIYENGKAVGVTVSGILELDLVKVTLDANPDVLSSPAYPAGSSGSVTAEYSSYDDLTISVVSSEPEPPIVGAVALMPIPDSLAAGSSVEIVPMVAGSGAFDSSCVCVISGGVSSGTYLLEDEPGKKWTLHIGPDEIISRIRICVTSVENPDVDCIKWVNIIPSGSTDDGSGDSGGGSGGSGGSTGEDSGDGGGSSGGSGGSSGGGSGDSSGDGSGESGGSSGDGSGEAGETPTTPQQAEKEEAKQEGNSSADELAEAIPDYSDGFMDALRGFAGSMTYTGTEAKLIIPTVRFPELPGVVPAFTIMEQTSVDFGDYIAMMPEWLLLLVRSLLTVALIVYCFRQLYSTVEYVLTLRGGRA